MYHAISDNPRCLRLHASVASLLAASRGSGGVGRYVIFVSVEFAICVLKLVKSGLIMPKRILISLGFDKTTEHIIS